MFERRKIRQGRSNGIFGIRKKWLGEGIKAKFYGLKNNDTS
jgi:hypothetical protein